MKDENKNEQVQKAYIYLVKTPSSNDLAVCASNSVLIPGTKVVAPTRYGLDLSIVIGSASSIGMEYTPGCSKCLGACHFEPTKNPEGKDGEEDLVASGYVQTQTQSQNQSQSQSQAETQSQTQSQDQAQSEEVVYEADGQRLTLGPLPKFEFVDGTFSVEGSRQEEKAQADKEAKEEKNLWDKAYREPELVEVDGDVTWIDHVASAEEVKKYEENKQAEQNAICVCREKIEKLGLNMKLVTAHFLLCEPKVLFFFTADERVDFRELVKELVSVFRIRIELRQIGVRDESRVLGGLAVCGRDFCCHCVSDKLNPVTIKMAKEQNLSLNSMKISGPCGRLLCCLSYEYDFYCEEKQAYPPEGAKIKLGNEIFRVQEVNILSHKMTLTGSEGRSYSVPREEVYFDTDTGHWEVDRTYQEELLSN